MLQQDRNDIYTGDFRRRIGSRDHPATERRRWIAVADDDRDGYGLDPDGVSPLMSIGRLLTWKDFIK